MMRHSLSPLTTRWGYSHKTIVPELLEWLLGLPVCWKRQHLRWRNLMSIHRRRRRLVRGVYMSQVRISRILMPIVERVDVCKCTRKKNIKIAISENDSLRKSAERDDRTNAGAEKFVNSHASGSPPFHINKQTKERRIEAHEFKLKSIIITSAIGYNVGFEISLSIDARSDNCACRSNGAFCITI